ncbi:bifunctional diguanylate cyclase/phosphodiesterase [uncultured Roseobacter sp.]|uniref:putative bifunctional diguanylate cyclase/phosphodiesterase n=1 Tax=uncultured Roseobacter sp. TaxID=114847 RepID=UPI00261CF66D|nr:bifunctional diguanylate cyclase/phosphodiesterase [uncultured Roseobacter sp.]
MAAFPDIPTRPRRPLSRVLAKVTLLLALVLGMIFGAMQVITDLRQEKDAVQYSAEEFLASVAPSAASAAYNFYRPAAEQVASGLFTQRAIASVTILNEGTVMIDMTRQLDPTLPNLGALSYADPVVIERPLYTPPETGRNEIIGSISITVDRAVVAPAFVNRLVSYFLLATIKNVALGVLLIAIIYTALARHIVNLSDLIGRWSPGSGALAVPQPPALLKDTELALLGQRLQDLADTAVGELQRVEQSHLAAVKSNSELSQKSENLSQAVEKQNAELKQANQRLKELAERDALTGLNNRGFFDKQAAAAFAEARAAGQHVSVMLLDVDYFKAYNDYYGHQDGDRCLSKVARIFHDTLVGTNAIVARYGGEEFVALLRDTDTDTALEQAAKVHNTLRASKIEHPRSTIADRITASIGLASSPPGAAQADPTLDQLISAADEALYEAKRRGRNRTVVSTDDIRDTIRKTRLQAQNLLRAIETEAFEPFFQPQFDARSGALVGVEALVRWRRDNGVIASPDAFLKTAAANGFLPMIDRIVLDGVTAFMAAAAQAGVPVPRLSLNTPRENLLERDYVHSIIALAKSSDTQIVLELLETALFDAPDDVVLWQLDALRSAGVEIEIDDFGTGHTSIVSLMALQPSRLKIAKEIVIPMLDNPAYDRIVHSIVQISTALDIDVLAEGVETQQISDRLVALGCPLQQGYHFARPMSAEAYLKRFAESPGATAG